jgi:hypothetical protein
MQATHAYPVAGARHAASAARPGGPSTTLRALALAMLALFDLYRH